MTKPTLCTGEELTRETYSFTAEETVWIHEALRAALHEAIRHPYRDQREQRRTLYELAWILTKIDGRLRPIGDTADT